MKYLPQVLLSLSMLLGGSACSATELERFTESHTRLVWLQDAWEHRDVFSDQGRLRLVALDSRDRRGERILVDGPAPLRKPMITPCGEFVVYSRADTGSVWILPWKGGEPRELGPGTALTVWRDPADAQLWVYAGRDPVSQSANAFRSVVRFPLEMPDAVEPVWNAAPVGRDSFRLSADGRFAAGLFPWPDAGIADLREGTWTRVGRGCWVSMSPDDSRRMWILDGPHRAVAVHDTLSDDRWNVNLANQEAIGGHEVYHPAWSNHPDYLVMTGPFTIRQGGNNIRGGGPSVEIHVGRFSEDQRHVEAWLQVTNNAHANFFPDLWIASGAEARAQTRVAGEGGGAVADPDESEALPARGVLREISTRPTPEDIHPYTKGLVAHVYEILDDPPHPRSGERILVAGWIIWDGEVLPVPVPEAGATETLLLRDYDTVPELEGERMVMDVEELLLPLYYNLNSVP